MERLSRLRQRRILAAAALGLYAALAVKLLGGVPASRDVLVPLLIGGFLLMSLTSLTRLRRLVISLAVDWFPFVLMLWLYDLIRGYADGLWLGVHVRPEIDADRWIGLGAVPTVWLQQHLWHGDASLRWYDYGTWLVYMSYFFGTTAVLAVLWWRAPTSFRRFAAMVVVLAFVGCATYVLFPAAPPWLAAQDGTLPSVERVIGPVSGHVPLVKFEPLWESGTQYSNAVAAVPSLHAAYTLLIVLFLFPRLRSRFRYLLWLYPPAMAFALVYSGEHYVVDVLVGWLYAVVVYVAVGRAADWLGRRHDRDPAAGLLAQGDAHVLDGKLGRLGDVAADPDGEGLAEGALVAEAGEIELQRLGFEAELGGPVLDGDGVEVGLAGDRTDGRQLVARHLDGGDPGVREGLEPGVVLGAGVSESDELLLHDEEW